MFLRRLRKKLQWERESFRARIAMENDAQREIQARLKALELQVKNAGRLK